MEIAGLPLPAVANAFGVHMISCSNALVLTPSASVRYVLQRETSVVTYSTFTRLQEQPNEIISIRYDSRENLIASGVIREPMARPYVPPVPRAFPQSDTLSYVPDPR